MNKNRQGQRLECKYLKNIEKNKIEPVSENTQIRTLGELLMAMVEAPEPKVKAVDIRKGTIAEMKIWKKLNKGGRDELV